MPRQILSLLGLSIALAQPAMAGPDRLSFMVGSVHVNPISDFNEVNPGVFATWERNTNFHLGAYYNSYDRISVAGFLGWPLVSGENFSVDAIVGLALYPVDGRRFPVHLGDVIPLGGLQVRVGNFFGRVFPGDGAEVDAIFSFGVTVPLSDRR